MHYTTTMTIGKTMKKPVTGVGRGDVRDMFNESRGNRRHEAIDIFVPTGTPVIATDDGVVKSTTERVVG